MGERTAFVAPGVSPDRVWTSARRRRMVVGLYFDLQFNTADIADELDIAEHKVLAILDEHRTDEIAADQAAALVGPFMPLGPDPKGDLP
jgi:hypothetical protein